MVSDPVQLLLGALRIYSPTGEERKLAEYLCVKMKSLGYKRVKIDKAGNATGQIGSGGKMVLLCGHMDTVPGKLTVMMKKGRIFGRGAADAKAALCALLVAGSRAAGAGIQLTFVGATQEEGSSEGIQAIIKSGRTFDYAVFGEPSGASRLTIGYRGRVAMKLSIQTEGGHAASPWARASAVDEFYSILAAVRKYQATKSRGDDHFRSLSISPTLVEAGSYHNIIPPVCRATFDIRLPPGQASAEVEKELRKLIDESHGQGASVTVDFDEATEAYQADPNSDLVRAFQRAIILKLKGRPVFVNKTSTGDMNTLASATGAKCVTYGPADSQLSHTDIESVQVVDYLNSIEVINEAINQLGLITARR